MQKLVFLSDVGDERSVRVVDWFLRAWYLYQLLDDLINLFLRTLFSLLMNVFLLLLCEIKVAVLSIGFGVGFFKTREPVPIENGYRVAGPVRTYPTRSGCPDVGQVIGLL